MTSDNPTPALHPSAFSYILMPGKTMPGSEYGAHYEKAFLLWKHMWKEVYASQGSLDAFHQDDFFRQSVVCGLFHNEEPVALHLYTLFDLTKSVCREHAYFNFFPSEFISRLQARGANWVMSMEFLTANPQYRKKQLGFSAAELVSGCGVLFLKTVEADAAIAPARKDVKVNEMSLKAGFEVWESDVVKRNFVCDLVVGFRDNVHLSTDPELEKRIRGVWDRRIDFTGMTHESAKSTNRKAA